MHFAPSLSNLNGRTVVLVGTGAQALAASRRLVDAGAHVRWFVEDVDAGEEVLMESRPGQTDIILGAPQPQDLAGADVVLAPTDVVDATDTTRVSWFNRLVAAASFG